MPSPAKPRKSIPRRDLPKVSSARENGSLVVLGASAGGLKAIGELLAGLPATFGAPIVAVLHLDPSHLSHLAPLLQRTTALRVEVAKTRQLLRAGFVYVAPPDRHVEVRGNRLELTRKPRVRFSRPSIDLLFASAAKSYGDQVIAVILSGTGSDGSAGAATVRTEGGLVIAQDPKTAQSSGMPANAIASKSVDIVLPIASMPTVLSKAVSRSRSGPIPAEWTAVLAVLRSRLGTDFAHYRPSTLKRRLARRVFATRQPTVADYIAFIRKDASELRTLHSEFLIKVSSFFRDPKEWDGILRNAIRPLVLSRPGPKEFRIWSAGCATGEEAYTLAILFSEALAGTGDPDRFKVFATDLDDRALASARRGSYTSAQVAGVSPARLRRHFEKDGSGWRINKDLRRNVIFGKHDLLRDPPLASIDLLVCRNVLIYFSPEQAKAVTRRFAYSLQPGGVLFLGKSERLRRSDVGLESMPHSAHALRRPQEQRLPASLRILAKTRSRNGAPDPPTQDAAPATSNLMALRDLVLGAPTVTVFGVNARHRIMLWNKAAAAFFGVSSPDALGKTASQVVGPKFWDALCQAVEDAGSSKRSPGVTRLGHGPNVADQRYLDLDWIEFTGPHESRNGFLFVAVDATDRHRREKVPSGRERTNEKVLMRNIGAEEALRSAHEELHVVNEQLQSTSQEQQTLNEELESRNEELETVNEELQSLNEELNTLNEEVGTRIAEADRLTAFLGTVLDLSPVSIIGCDTKDRVTSWNEMATKEFRLSEDQAMGKDLFELLPVLDVASVHQLVRSATENPVAKVSLGPNHAGRLIVRLGVVRDRAGHRQGYCLRVGHENDSPVRNGNGSSKDPLRQLPARSRTV